MCIRDRSLGGLADRAGVEVSDDAEEEDLDPSESTMSSLKERTDEWSEDIAEKEAAIPQQEDEEEQVASEAAIEQELEKEE